MKSAELFDVVIVGFGPVGSTLSNLLTQQGLHVAVLEREASVYHLARAGHFDAEIMRVFQSIGIAEIVEATTEITNASRFVDVDGAMLMEWKRGGGKGPLGWISDYMFFQPTLESILRARLSESGGAGIHLLHDVFAIRAAEDHAVVEAENTSTGRLTTLRGKYVVGCDGARSLVRRMIGSEHEDFGFKQRWLVIDVKQHHDLGLEKVSTHHCNPERPMYASVLGHNILRWELMLKDSDDVAAVTSTDAVWNFIENSVRPISRKDGTIIRSATYTFESLLADTWRKGRLLIAGDAAHRTPPFLGQGMCAGIRDAANLAWKLAAVCSGRAQEALLDTYEVERKPHVRAYIQGAVEIGRLLQMNDLEELATRAHLRSNPKAFAPPNPSLGPGLSGCYGIDGQGWQFPQPASNGVLIDDRIGHTFALVFLENFLTAGQQNEISARYPLLRLVLLEGDAGSPLRELYRAKAAVLRPDRYVHALAQSPRQVTDILDELPVRLAA